MAYLSHFSGLLIFICCKSQDVKQMSKGIRADCAGSIVYFDSMIGLYEYTVLEGGASSPSKGTPTGFCLRFQIVSSNRRIRKNNLKSPAAKSAMKKSLTGFPRPSPCRPALLPSASAGFARVLPSCPAGMLGLRLRAQPSLTVGRS